MRVLVSSTPGAGHIFPMVPIVQALRAAGHDVLWATGPDGQATVRRLGIATVVAGLDSGPRGQAAIALTPELGQLPPRDRRPIFGPMMFGQVAAPAMADDLRPIFDRERFDLIVTEPLELAAPALATARRIPHVTVGFGGLLPTALVSRLAQAVAPLWESEGLVAPPDAGLYRHLYLHPFPPALGSPPADLPILPSRPMVYDEADAAAPAWIEALGGERPFIYVTFGTESPGQPFATVLGALGDVDADAVLTVGRRVDPGSLPEAPGNVRVEQFVPQRWLLERASLVISHAGSGTLLGAAASAVPQLCLPMGADQFDNADAVVLAGLGACLDPHQVDVVTVAAQATRLLADSGTATAARAVAEQIAAMPEPRQLVAPIASLVA